MDLAKKIIAENVTRQGALAAVVEAQHEAEEKFFNKKTAKDEDLDKPFDQAAAALEKVPELVVYTAVELRPEVQQKLGKKAREIFDTDFFIDFKVDPDLLGGAALAWQGQYNDYSLRAQFEEKEAEVKALWQKKLAL